MHLSLEEELRLPSSDLRSHGWYHGAIPRSQAESLLNEDGQFLVRDCLSQPNDFVLSCRTAGAKLHFIINRVFILPNTLYERVQYQLEDDLFDTIADLVTFYVGNKQPITQKSGAYITKPVIRNVNLGVVVVDDAPPPPKPERNYCNVSAKRHQRLKREYSKVPFEAVNNRLGQLGSIDFNTKGINEEEIREVVHNDLKNNSARVLARSLAMANIRILRLEQNDSILTLGATSALEILTLPHGNRLLEALVERCDYLKLLVVSTIALAENQQHALDVLTKWIQVASEIKAAVGDLLGFQCIMMGLMSTPVVAMKSLWLELRQKHTELALLFETKLRQEMSSLLDRCDSVAPNTCVPNIYFYLSLLVQFTQRLEKIQFEKNGADFGLATLLLHLDNMRTIVGQTERFRRNATSVVKSSTTLDKRFAFFETEHLIGLFNTTDYANFDEVQKKNRVSQIFERLQSRCVQ